MTDRELLEAAAKAAGIELCWFEVPEGDPDCDAGWYCTNVTNGGCWNPLTDDGDALRLAVKLRLDITFIGNQACVNGIVTGGADDGECCRRAIIRAAAAMAGA